MRLTISLCLAVAVSALAQTSDAGADQLLSTSLAATAKAMHASIRRNLVEAAEAMPAESYDFKPTPQIRTFAQLMGHVTDVNLFFCSQAKSAPYPSKTSASTLTAKEAAVKALKDSLAYCDEVYVELTDAFQRSRHGRGIRQQANQDNPWRGSDVQHDAQQRTLRECRNLPAAEGNHTAFDSARALSAAKDWWTWTGSNRQPPPH
jgi:hypothetical protein